MSHTAHHPWSVATVCGFLSAPLPAAGRWLSLFLSASSRDVSLWCPVSNPKIRCVSEKQVRISSHCLLNKSHDEQIIICSSLSSDKSAPSSGQHTFFFQIRKLNLLIHYGPLTISSHNTDSPPFPFTNRLLFVDPEKCCRANRGAKAEEKRRAP